MPDGSGVSASTAAMGRAGGGPVSQGGALADLIATELIPGAANRIFSAFPSLKNAVGSETIDIKITVGNIDSKGGMLARAGYKCYSTGRPLQEGWIRFLRI